MNPGWPAAGRSCVGLYLIDSLHMACQVPCAGAVWLAASRQDPLPVNGMQPQAGGLICQTSVGCEAAPATCGAGLVQAYLTAWPGLAGRSPEGCPP